MLLSQHFQAKQYLAIVQYDDYYSIRMEKWLGNANYSVLIFFEGSILDFCFNTLYIDTDNLDLCFS